MAAPPHGGKIETDLRRAVGGNFTPHALGDAHRRIEERLRAAPLAYLDAFERLFGAPGLNARTLSNLHLRSFFERTSGAAPGRVHALAGRLATQYGAALSIADHAAEQDLSLTQALPAGETWSFVQRLDERRRKAPGGCSVVEICPTLVRRGRLNSSERMADI